MSDNTLPALGVVGVVGLLIYGCNAITNMIPVAANTIEEVAEAKAMSDMAHAVSDIADVAKIQATSMSVTTFLLVGLLVAIITLVFLYMRDNSRAQREEKEYRNYQLYLEYIQMRERYQIELNERLEYRLLSDDTIELPIYRED